MNTYFLIPSLLGLSALSSLAQTQHPNIVLINVDDFGWADMSCQASGYYETPSIDQFRKEGVYFSNGYAAAANSAPSRASMLTGCYSSRHGVYTVNNSDRGKASTRKLIPTTNTPFPAPQYTLLPQTLKKAGYQTCHVGKWHVGEDPTTQGIDVNIGGTRLGSPRSYFSPFKNPALKDGPKGKFLTDHLTDEALAYLKTGRDMSKPFFLYFATHAVHTPLRAKPEKIAKYAQKTPTKAHHNKVYAGLVESMDENVGRLLSYLKESGLEDNTIIIFTSDNGGVYDISKQWPLRAGKGSFYEGGIRVPIIFKWKGHTQANTVNDTPISQLDFYPTLLDMIGLAPDQLQLDGTVITPLVEGKPAAAHPLYWHFPAYLEGGNKESTDPIFRSRPVSAMRQGDWKLIYNYESEKAELYNLKADLSEKKDLSQMEKQRCQNMLTQLRQWLEDTNAPTQFQANPKYKAPKISE